jgi:hypothetical protein
MKSASIANSRRSYVATAEAIDRLESQVAALKHNPWQLEREINNLLKALNAEPETERDYLKERLFTIAATVMLTAATMKSLDTPISRLFSPSTLNKTEQVQLSRTKGLDKPLVKVAPIIAKPDAIALRKYVRTIFEGGIYTISYSLKFFKPLFHPIL